MAANIVLSQDTRRPKKDNTFPLIFRLTHHSKTTAIGTGYAVGKKDWDAKNRRIRSSYKGTVSPTRLNNLLAKKKAEMMDVITRLEDNNELRFLSVKQLKERLINPHHKTTVFVFTQKLIDELITAQRIGTASSYRDVLKILKRFRNKRDMTFDELNLEFLNKLENWHLSKGNSLGGLAVYMRTIRAIYNKAIKAGVADQEGYPFKHYRIKRGSPRKRAITIDTLQKIRALKLKKGSLLERDRNIFLMSFFLNGMPYADMARLKRSNIIDGRIKYQRQKTKVPFDIKIHDQLKPILDTFTKDKSKEDYLLPAIKRKSPVGQYKDIKEARLRYNKNLKELAKLAGIEEQLSSYVSRHSFASSADDLGIPITAISQMLGHKAIGTTQAYLDHLRKNKIDEYQDQVFKEL
ncbi:MAG: transposase [Cyclobacteriaceae bacterium]|nr:MAG: transposase [Cyclobacteriaceae bacterium]